MARIGQTRGQRVGQSHVPLKTSCAGCGKTQHAGPAREEEGGWQIKFILHSRLRCGKGNGSEGGNHKDLRSMKSVGVLANLCPIRIS